MAVSNLSTSSVIPLVGTLFKTFLSKSVVSLILSRTNAKSRRLAIRRAAAEPISLLVPRRAVATRVSATSSTVFASPSIYAKVSASLDC